LAQDKKGRTICISSLIHGRNIDHGLLFKNQDDTIFRFLC